MNHGASDNRRAGFHYGWVVLMLGVVVVFASLGLARFGYTLVLPPMQKALSLNDTEAGALATGNLFGYLCLALIGGGLAARFSPRRVIAVALVVVGAMMLLTSTARGFVEALTWRTLTGMGSGASNVPVMALVAAWFARSRRGLAAGIAVSGSSVGLILTGAFIPPLLGIAGGDGWRACWVAMGMAALAVGIFAWFFLRDRPGEMGLDPIGAAPEGPAGARNPSFGAAPVPAAPTTPAPPASGLLPSWSRVYRSRAVWHLALVYITFGFSYIIFATFFARYLQGELGYTKERAGGLWQLVGWLSIFCGAIWGWVSDVLGRKHGLALVSFVQATAYALFALWRSDAGAIAAATLFGLTAWSIPAIMAAACGDQVGPRLAPAALGFLTLFMGIGQALGPFVAGRIADAAGSFSPALLLACGVAALGGTASLFLPRAE